MLNPHASLLLGPQDFETPAEIDGLLDDYFNTPEMSDPSLNHSDGSGRRGRQLFDTPDAARQKIMNIREDSRKAREFEAALSSMDATRGQKRSSSVYPHSQISNQFDLTVTEADSEDAYVSIPLPLRPRH